MIFRVPFFARELVKVAQRYGVEVNYQHNFVTVGAKPKMAIFEIADGDKQGQRIEVPYETQAGWRRLAIEAGKRMGRKPKLTAYQQKSARIRLANGVSSWSAASARSRFPSDTDLS